MSLRHLPPAAWGAVLITSLLILVGGLGLPVSVLISRASGAGPASVPSASASAPSVSLAGSPVAPAPTVAEARPAVIPTPSRFDREPADVVLTLDDLGQSGYTVTQAIPRDNQRAARDSADPAGRLRQLQAWGREAGYMVEFTRRPAPANGAAKVSNGVSRYATPEGARDAFADYERTVRAGISNPEDLPTATPGDRGLVVRGQGRDGNVAINVVTVGLLHGNFIIDVTLSGSGTVPPEEALRLAAVVDQKLTR